MASVEHRPAVIPRGVKPATTTAGSAPRAASSMAGLLPLFAAVGVLLVVLAVGGKLLNDPDIYWHIAVGDWIFGKGFPEADPFSATLGGAPWIAKEWLSQLAYALAYRLGGWTTVAALAALAFAASFALLARALQRNLAPIPVLVALSAAFVLAAPHALARPHMLAMPLMVLWVAGLARAIDENRSPPFVLLPLMVVWANLHGSFLLGILLAGAAGLEAIVAAEKKERRRAFLDWGLFGLASLAAACITPYGAGTALAALDVLKLGVLLPAVTEFRPPDFSKPGALEIVLLAAIGLGIWRGVKLHPVRILTLLGLVHLALSGVRYAETLGLLAPLYLAAPLARQFPALRREPGPGLNAKGIVSGGIAALAAIAATVGFATTKPSPDARITPTAAVEILKAANAGPLLNDYDFGGYLIFVRVPPFVDGRAELYGGDFVLAFKRAVTLENLAGLGRMLTDRKIGATLLKPSTPAVAWLDRQPGWERLYADEIAVVHRRR
jgi:hypothetical protein